MLEDYKKALDLYDKAIKIYPKDAAAWSNKGSALGKLGKSEDAEKYMTKQEQMHSNIHFSLIDLFSSTEFLPYLCCPVSTMPFSLCLITFPPLGFE